MVALWFDFKCSFKLTAYIRFIPPLTRFPQFIALPISFVPFISVTERGGVPSSAGSVAL
jgi:hypothetical protein